MLMIACTLCGLYTLDCSLHSLHQVVIVYGERCGKIVCSSQGDDSQAGFPGCVLIYQLIHNLIDRAITSRSYQDVVVCIRVASKSDSSGAFM